MSRPEPTAVPLEPLLSLNDLAGVLNANRRTLERMRSSGRLPRPDMHVGKMMRWKPETIREWIAGQARGN